MILKILKILLFTTLYLNFSNLLCYENKIIVKIDNQVITNYDLKNKILTTLVLSNEEINQENINNAKSLALKNLIELKIKENELKNFKIPIDTIEINNNLNILANNNIDNFKNKFILNNLDYETYKNDLIVELKWRKLIYLLYKKKVNIDNTEVELQIEKLIKENNKKNKEYRLVELATTYDSSEEKERKIKEINEQLKSKKFEEVSKIYSNSFDNNNIVDLGWINSKSLSKNILTAIKDLKVNEISKPIISGNNLLYLKVKDLRETEFKIDNYEKLKNQIRSVKENQKFRLYSNSHISKLKNLVTIEYQ